MRRIVAAAIAVWASTTMAQTAPPAVPVVAARLSPAMATAAAVDRLLMAMGGREVWARATGYRVTAIHEIAGERSPRESTIWADFAAPRTRAESRALGSSRITLLDGERVVRRRDGDSSPADAATIASERGWWRGNIYRTVHRLAANDPMLRAYRTDKRLVVLENGEPLLWIRLDVDGRPTGFGGDFGGPGTDFGPLRTFGAVRVPSTSSRDDGRWTARVTGFELNPDLAAVSFTAP